MSGGGKGGSQRTSVEIPAWLEEAAQRNLARADQASTIGYTPYYGPDVAALTPLQVQAMQGTNQAAGAFGLGQVDPMAGMPQSQTFAGGVQGYSSAPLYQQSLDALQAASPGQFAALQAPFINPVTGGTAAQAPSVTPYQPMIAMTGGSDGGYIPTSTGPRPTSSGTGSFGLPDPMSGGFTGTNFSGPVGGVINRATGGSSGMGGGK